MLDDKVINASESAYKFVIITLDSHSAGPVSRVQRKLKPYFPSLEISVHAAAEWSENPKALEKAKNDAIIMHPGPMNRGIEIDTKLADDINKSVIREQVELGVAVRMACLKLFCE